MIAGWLLFFTGDTPVTAEEVIFLLGIGLVVYLGEKIIKPVSISITDSAEKAGKDRKLKKQIEQYARFKID